MAKLQFLALIFAGLQLSASAPLLVTTSSENAIADILAAFKGTDITTSTGIPATPAALNDLTSVIIPTPTSNTLITGLEYLTPTQPVSGTTTAVSTAKNTEFPGLAGLFSGITASSTSTATSLPSATGTTIPSSNSGTQSGIFQLLVSVVKALAHTFGLSDSVVNNVENALEALDGEVSGSRTSTSDAAISTGLY